MFHELFERKEKWFATKREPFSRKDFPVSEQRRGIFQYQSREEDEDSKYIFFLLAQLFFCLSFAVLKNPLVSSPTPDSNISHLVTQSLSNSDT